MRNGPEMMLKALHLGVLLLLFDLESHQHHHRDEEGCRDDDRDDCADPADVKWAGHRIASTHQHPTDVRIMGRFGDIPTLLAHI